jgi:hypothetical protein
MFTCLLTETGTSPTLSNPDSLERSHSLNEKLAQYHEETLAAGETDKRFLFTCFRNCLDGCSLYQISPVVFPFVLFFPLLYAQRVAARCSNPHFDCDVRHYKSRHQPYLLPVDCAIHDEKVSRDFKIAKVAPTTIVNVPFLCSGAEFKGANRLILCTGLLFQSLSLFLRGLRLSDHVPYHMSHQGQTRSSRGTLSDEAGAGP